METITNDHSETANLNTVESSNTNKNIEPESEVRDREAQDTTTVNNVKRKASDGSATASDSGPEGPELTLPLVVGHNVTLLNDEANNQDNLNEVEQEPLSFEKYPTIGTQQDFQEGEENQIQGVTQQGETQLNSDQYEKSHINNQSNSTEKVNDVDAESAKKVTADEDSESNNVNRMMPNLLTQNDSGQPSLPLDQNQQKDVSNQNVHTKTGRNTVQVENLSRAGSSDQMNKGIDSFHLISNGPHTQSPTVNVTAATVADTNTTIQTYQTFASKVTSPGPSTRPSLQIFPVTGAAGMLLPPGANSEGVKRTSFLHRIFGGQGSKIASDNQVNRSEQVTPVHKSTSSDDDGKEDAIARATSFVAPLAGAPPSNASSFVQGKPPLLKRSSTQFSQNSAWAGEIGPLNNDHFSKRKSFLAGPPGLEGLLQQQGAAGGPAFQRMESGTINEMTRRHLELQQIQSLKQYEMVDEEGNMDWQSWLFAQKLYLWLFLEEPFLSWKTTAYSCFILCCIVAALFISINSVRYEESGSSDDAIFMEFDSMPNQLGNADTQAIIKTCVCIILTLETFVRFLVAPVKQAFFLQMYGMYDVLAILPFWINDMASLSTHIQWLHVLSLFQTLFWLLKLCRYFSGWYLLSKALSDSLRALAIPAFFLLIIVAMGACSLYWCEQSVPQQVNDCVYRLDVCTEALSTEDIILNDSVRNECGRKVVSLADAIVFCLVCVISIDVSPAFGIEVKSTLGKWIAILMMVLGVVFMAMPIAIVGTCFSETWFNQDQIVLIQKVRNRMKQQGFSMEDIRDVFDEVDEDRSGEIEFAEFRKMLEAFHFTSLATARKLFNYFDTTGSSSISFQEFALGIFPEIGELEFKKLTGADELQYIDPFDLGGGGKSDNQTQQQQLQQHQQYTQQQQQAQLQQNNNINNFQMKIINPDGQNSNFQGPQGSTRMASKAEMTIKESRMHQAPKEMALGANYNRASTGTLWRSPASEKAAQDIRENASPRVGSGGQVQVNKKSSDGAQGQQQQASTVMVTGSKINHSDLQGPGTSTFIDLKTPNNQQNIQSSIASFNHQWGRQPDELSMIQMSRASDMSMMQGHPMGINTPNPFGLGINTPNPASNKNHDKDLREHFSDPRNLNNLNNLKSQVNNNQQQQQQLPVINVITERSVDESDISPSSQAGGFVTNTGTSQSLKRLSANKEKKSRQQQQQNLNQNLHHHSHQSDSEKRIQVQKLGTVSNFGPGGGAGGPGSKVTSLKAPGAFKGAGPRAPMAGPPYRHGMFGGTTAGAANQESFQHMQKLTTRITALEMKIDENFKKVMILLETIAEQMGANGEYRNIKTKRSSEKAQAEDDNENRMIWSSSARNIRESRETSNFDRTPMANPGISGGPRSVLQSYANSVVQSSDRLSSYRGFSALRTVAGNSSNNNVNSSIGGPSGSTLSGGAGGGPGAAGGPPKGYQRGRRLSHASIFTGINMNKPRSGQGGAGTLAALDLPSSTGQSALDTEEFKKKLGNTLLDPSGQGALGNSNSGGSRNNSRRKMKMNDIAAALSGQTQGVGTGQGQSTVTGPPGSSSSGTTNANVNGNNGTNTNAPMSMSALNLTAVVESPRNNNNDPIPAAQQLLWGPETN